MSETTYYRLTPAMIDGPRLPEGIRVVLTVWATVGPAAFDEELEAEVRALEISEVLGPIVWPQGLSPEPLDPLAGLGDEYPTLEAGS